VHIPDGFLDVKTAATAAVVSAAAVGVALRQARLRLGPRSVPLMGLAAAFVFAAQMLNFPVAGGTSGHMVGSVLTAVLLGPSAAVIVISTVLIVQAMVFADGGVMALGANIFNMALIGAVGGWAVYRLVCRVFSGLRGQVLAAAFAAWCAIVAGAVACAAELAISATVQWRIVLPAMAGVHMLIGFGEALMTALILASIAKVRRDLLDRQTASASASYRELAVYGLLISLGLAVFASPLASKWPDGLDRAAQTLGFEGKALAEPVVASPVPDYRMPGVGSPAVATSIAGGAGTVAAFGLAWGLARALVPRKRPAFTETPAAG